MDMLLKRFATLFILCVLLTWVAAFSFAATRHVVVEALPEYTSFRPGSPLRVAFVFQIQKDWHTFWINPVVPQGRCASVEWKLPEGWRSEGIQFPAPKRVGGGTTAAFGYLDEMVLIDTLVPPVEETADEVTLQAKVTWQAAQTEIVEEETRCTLTFHRAGKTFARPLRADHFRIWQGRIPRPNNDLHPKLEKRFLAKSYTLEFPGTKGQACPEFFPNPSQGLDMSKPLTATFTDGLWSVGIPLRDTDVKHPKVLEGVLEPGPTGGAPVWVSVRFP
jgi:DsbC/DsbD-like thiol-disulfide interchange protein